MDGEGTIIIPIIGYIVALISPLLGLIYGAIYFTTKKRFRYTANTVDTSYTLQYWYLLLV